MYATPEHLKKYAHSPSTYLYVFLWYNTGQSHPYLSGLVYWHWGNLMIAPVPVKLS